MPLGPSLPLLAVTTSVPQESSRLALMPPILAVIGGPQGVLRDYVVESLLPNWFKYWSSQESFLEVELTRKFAQFSTFAEGALGDNIYY